VGALLTLFRSGAEPTLQHVGLSALIERLPLEGLSVDVAAGAAVEADPDLLAAALLNLLDNALRHGARRVVLTTPSAQCVRLHDDGPGVSAERRRSLQVALDSAGYDNGTGLGLMLADVVARTHGGALALPEPAGGRGFVAELRLAA
jgi:signal transduction histidine kinase